MHLASTPLVDASGTPIINLIWWAMSIEFSAGIGRVHAFKRNANVKLRDSFDVALEKKWKVILSTKPIYFFTIILSVCLCILC